MDLLAATVPPAAPAALPAGRAEAPAAVAATALGRLRAASAAAKAAAPAVADPGASARVARVAFKLTAAAIPARASWRRLTFPGCGSASAAARAATRAGLAGLALAEPALAARAGLALLSVVAVAAGAAGSAASATAADVVAFRSAAARVGSSAIAKSTSGQLLAGAERSFSITDEADMPFVAGVAVSAPATTGAVWRGATPLRHSCQPPTLTSSSNASSRPARQRRRCGTATGGGNCCRMPAHRWAGGSWPCSASRLCRASNKGSGSRSVMGVASCFELPGGPRAGGGRGPAATCWCLRQCPAGPRFPGASSPPRRRG